ncbi:hypothetical protein K450DRAFT_226360 [Umbelopsis ramanniana AG]|uniref:Uncharacterized protein n=1 Tax=Umbelopsis ramanniana AG TaxID=1314678 RepID=A0AAD5EFC4_UMBRA|nr:uncharacterized protein K450DRAFT_226360 [Umbelopsis ramanniana AG]KAI8582668.1 hypothetical protein K450DRAFT_226360 [Umbelopsis ramanniana AG]
MQESPKHDDTGTAKRLELSISPASSLGPFRIGTSIWEIINFLRERSSFFPQVELKYSQEDPLGVDFIIDLPQNGLSLRCDGTSQRLRCIECYDISKVKLVYQNNDVSSNRTIPTFLLIYKSFGPTYPGEFDSAESVYTLSYPGLSFTFPIPSRHQELYSSSTELPLEFPDGTTPIASHVFVYNGSQNWRQATLPPLSKFIGETNAAAQGRYGKKGRREVDRVIAEPTVGVTLHFPMGGAATATPDTHSEDSSLSNSPSNSTSVRILLRSTTPQDLLSDLGKPSCIFYKEEDKMRIHSVLGDNPTDKSNRSGGEEEHEATSDSENVVSDENAVDKGIAAAQPTDYFFNYFYLGIDILFDGGLHVCKKIVLHGNIPCHFDFQRYKRCPFALRFPQKPSDNSKDEEILVDVDSGPSSNDIPGTLKIQALKKRIPWSLSNGVNDESKKQKPVILTRGSSEQNPFGSSYLTGYDEGIVMEVMKNGCIPTLVLF